MHVYLVVLFLIRWWLVEQHLLWRAKVNAMLLETTSQMHALIYFVKFWWESSQRKHISFSVKTTCSLMSKKSVARTQKVLRIIWWLTKQSWSIVRNIKSVYGLDWFPKDLWYGTLFMDLGNTPDVQYSR